MLRALGVADLAAVLDEVHVGLVHLVRLEQPEEQVVGLAGHRLRSHGGLGEQKVPFMVSHRLRPEWVSAHNAHGLRNYDIFDAVLNGVAS